jgi:predicted nucleic acid-binding protein
VIYLDTSVALAHLLGEGRRPPDILWSHILVSSRLLEYEAWGRIHARGLTKSHAEPLRELLGRIAFLELAQPVLARALEPFRVPLRTLDALHLASVEFLRGRNHDVRLASYDRRMLDAAAAMSMPVFDLPS